MREKGASRQASPVTAPLYPDFPRDEFERRYKAARALYGGKREDPSQARSLISARFWWTDA
jgi:hypothetical protein